MIAPTPAMCGWLLLQAGRRAPSLPDPGRAPPRRQKLAPLGRGGGGAELVSEPRDISSSSLNEPIFQFLQKLIMLQADSLVYQEALLCSCYKLLFHSPESWLISGRGGKSTLCLHWDHSSFEILGSQQGIFVAQSHSRLDKDKILSLIPVFGPDNPHC